MAPVERLTRWPEGGANYEMSARNGLNGKIVAS